MRSHCYIESCDLAPRKRDSLPIEIEEQIKLQAYSFKEIPNRAHIEQLPDFLDDRRRIQVFPRNVSFW